MKFPNDYSVHDILQEMQKHHIAREYLKRAEGDVIKALQWLFDDATGDSLPSIHTKEQPIETISGTPVFNANAISREIRDAFNEMFAHRAQWSPELIEMATAQNAEPAKFKRIPKL